MPGKSLSELMARAARELQHQSGAAATMQTSVEIAMSDIEGADGAALSIIRRGGGVTTLASTSEQARRGDELQYELAEGPCLEATWEDHLVYSPDFAAERRWPRWAAQVSDETGYHSLMAFELFTTSDAVGGLNLYSRRAHGFDTTDRDYGVALAAHIAVAVRDAQQLDNLQLALDSRTVISQAVGILMERYGVPSEAAFAVLSRLAASTHIKVRDLAAELCSTGTLPDGAVGEALA
jgi:transcriptional regulator with GAF, ATPase, and Fis domain